LGRGVEFADRTPDGERLMARPRRVTVVTSGHLSTCPRMLKAADALAEGGFRVRVVATNHEPWATDADADVRASRPWPVTLVNYRRGEPRSVYWRSGIRHRAARAMASAVGPGRVPLRVVANAFGRVHEELVDAIAAEPADLIYGGTAGGLAAVAAAASRLGVPYGLDLEDFHSGEDVGRTRAVTHSLALRIEGSVLPPATFLTTSSGDIAAAYRATYGVNAAVVHNTFPLPDRPPDFSPAAGNDLRLYWFSQTIAGSRGLEQSIRAIGAAGISATLTVRGRPRNGYLASLSALAAACGARVGIRHEPPASPDAMIDLARGYDVGLSLEQPVCANRELCLPNKIFTYILAGLAVVISDTPGQHELGVDLGAAAALVAPDDVSGVAAAFARWARDPALLMSARQAAWRAAMRRWHWEHALERGRLQELVRKAVA
jgi:glycosyltransferase involved in cell wall biosynthesis